MVASYFVRSKQLNPLDIQIYVSTTIGTLIFIALNYSFILDSCSTENQSTSVLQYGMSAITVSHVPCTAAKVCAQSGAQICQNSAPNSKLVHNNIMVHQSGNFSF